jgi:lysine 6-dehydrogenase
MSSPRVFIAGSGRQSVAAGYDLVRFNPGLELTLGDASMAQAQNAADRIRSLTPKASIEVLQIDVEDLSVLSSAMRGSDIALAGVPYHLNPFVHVAARTAGIPSVDMGSDLADLEAALGARASNHSSVAVFDSGVAPGLGNQLARMLAEELPYAKGVRIYCGGLPLNPRTALKYKPRFSLEGLIGEYSDPAVALRGGEVTELESLTGLEAVDVPDLGEMEAFVTSGGASIGPQLSKGKLESYDYKTLRFPGHCAAMKDFRDRGLWRKENFAEFATQFEEITADEDEKDQVLLIVDAWNDSYSKRVFIRLTFDEETGLSAMEQMTGYSAAIVLKKTLTSKLSPGLYAAEEIVSGREMLQELSHRGIHAKES